MKKEFFILGFVFVLFLIAMPGVLSEDINVDVKKLSSNEAIIQNTESPAILEIEITNTGGGDEFEIWSYHAKEIDPEGRFYLEEGESKNITSRFYGLQEIVDEGNVVFNYYIKRMSSRESQEEKSVVKVVKLENAIEINPLDITPDQETLTVEIRNKVYRNLENISLEMSSPFFDNVAREISLNSREKENINIQMDKEKYNNLLSGFHTLITNVEFMGETARIEGSINFIEEEIIDTQKDSGGFFIRKEKIKKTNEGNSVSGISITSEKNIISRLFTVFSESPDVVEREGGKVYFTWNEELDPGKSYEVETRTNWFYPLIIILLIVGIVYLVKRLTTEDVSLRKKIYFVKTKGGEFGLKVSIMINTNKYVENVKIKDKLPALAKIHERFGGERPSNIDSKNKKIEWEFKKLDAGERRMVSYVIYSKIGVLGRFALPPATAFYEKEGEMHESQSNRAYFIAEQAKKFR